MTSFLVETITDSMSSKIETQLDFILAQRKAIMRNVLIILQYSIEPSIPRDKPSDWTNSQKYLKTSTSFPSRAVTGCISLPVHQENHLVIAPCKFQGQKPMSKVGDTF